MRMTPDWFDNSTLFLILVSGWVWLAVVEELLDPHPASMAANAANNIPRTNLF
jgi:hypothetical protein